MFKQLIPVSKQQVFYAEALVDSGAENVKFLHGRKLKKNLRWGGMGVDGDFGTDENKVKFQQYLRDHKDELSVARATDGTNGHIDAVTTAQTRVDRNTGIRNGTLWATGTILAAKLASHHLGGVDIDPAIHDAVSNGMLLSALTTSALALVESINVRLSKSSLKQTFESAYNYYHNIREKSVPAIKDIRGEYKRDLFKLHCRSVGQHKVNSDWHEQMPSPTA